MRSLFGTTQGRRERPEDLIDKLCRESGRWMVVSREADDCRVRAVGDPKSVQYIDIRDGEHCRDILLQTWFSVLFPLENPPSGLFGRLLLRNFALKYAAWSIQIAGSCEAGLCCSARLPKAGLCASLFDFACRELVNEINDFHQELRDKFRYSVGGVVPGRVANTGNGTFGLPGQEVRFLGPVEVNTVLAPRPRLPDQRG